MPPCDYGNYPATWPQIRKRILARAENCCEQCGVANYAEGHRRSNGAFVECRFFYSCRRHKEKVIRIVLTVVHLCHDTFCEDETHMRLLCQLHHNQLDAEMRRKHAMATRAGKKTLRDECAGQMVLLFCGGTGFADTKYYADDDE